VLEQTCASLPYGDSETCMPLPTENLFTGKERDAETSANSNSTGSAGRCRVPHVSLLRHGIPRGGVGASRHDHHDRRQHFREGGRLKPMPSSQRDQQGAATIYGFNKDGIFLEMPYIYDATGAPMDRSSSVRWSDGDRVAKGVISTQIPNTRSCDPSVNGFTTQSDYVRDQPGQELSEFTPTATEATPFADRFLADRLTS
jgi:hypothetical protein